MGRGQAGALALPGGGSACSPKLRRPISGPGPLPAEPGGPEPPMAGLESRAGDGWGGPAPGGLGRGAQVIQNASITSLAESPALWPEGASAGQRQHECLVRTKRFIDNIIRQQGRRYDRNLPRKLVGHAAAPIWDPLTKPGQDPGLRSGFTMWRGWVLMRGHNDRQALQRTGACIRARRQARGSWPSLPF